MKTSFKALALFLCLSAIPALQARADDESGGDVDVPEVILPPSNNPGNQPGGGGGRGPIIRLPPEAISGNSSVLEYRVRRLENMVRNLQSQVFQLQERLNNPTDPGSNPSPSLPPGRRPRDGRRDLEPNPVNAAWRCMIQDTSGTPFVARGSTQEDAVIGVVALCGKFRGIERCQKNVTCEADGIH